MYRNLGFRKDGLVLLKIGNGGAAGRNPYAGPSTGTINRMERRGTASLPLYRACIQPFRSPDSVCNWLLFREGWLRVTSTTRLEQRSRSGRGLSSGRA